MPEVITFANMKGGVGKTTLCVSVSHELLTRGKKVLVIDNDPQFNATLSFIRPERFVPEVLEGKTIVDVYERPPRLGRSNRQALSRADLIRASYHLVSDRSKTLDIIPSRLELYATLDNPTGKENRLDSIIKSQFQDYDYILVDCPPTPSILTRAAFASSAHVVIPVTPDYFATIGLPQFLGTLLDFKEDQPDDHDVQVLGVVFTRVPTARSELVERSIRQVIEVANPRNVNVFRSFLPEYKVFQRSIWQNRPVQKVTGPGSSSRAKAAKAVGRIVDEILAKIKERRDGENN